jgi:hypothetical protein
MNIVRPLKNVPYRVVAVLIPVLVLILHLAVMYATLPYTLFLTVIGLMVMYILPPAGKETVIPLGIALGVPWFSMALAIAMVDIETGIFMALNFDLANKIPYLGDILVTMTEKMRLVITRHRWLIGLNFIAIVLMVMVPFFGSGGIRGSIAGKLLGLDDYLVFFGILAGTLIGCFGIALGSDAIIGYLCVNGFLPKDISVFICNRI